MDAAGMGEGVFAHDGFAALHDQPLMRETSREDLTISRVFNRTRTR
jgi:hypothetical protein